MKFLAPFALAACASAAMIRIDVGQSGLTFTPSTVNASTGDILDFHFHAINHSVVQGDFNNPCKPIQTGGFFSGFMPTSSGENANTFQVQVNSTDPIFFYCAQNTLTHCKSGMSGAVNPTSGQTLAAYQDKAKSADTAVSPASVFGGTIVSSGTTSPSSSSTGSAPAASSSCPAPKSGGSGGYRRRDTACPSAASNGAAVSIVAVLAAVGMAMMMV